MTAEDIARQWRNELGFVHTKAARARGELLEAYADGIQGGPLVGFVDHHMRCDGQLTIYAVAIDREFQRQGWASWMIEYIARVCRATSIVAKCTTDNEGGNAFWQAIGFTLIRVEEGKHRRLNVYRKELQHGE